MRDLFKDRSWSPMLLKEIDEPFDSDDYIFEIKFDGIRSVIFASPNKVTILSRNNKDMTHLFPELQEIKKLVKGKVIFDGEIISTVDGIPSFSKLQNRMHLKDEKKIELESREDPVIFIAFDILYENKNLVDLELMERKDILKRYDDTTIFKKTHMFDGIGIKLFKEVKKKKLEGIVAKLKTGTYHVDKRTDDFIKIKNIKSEEFIVGGYKDNPKSNTASLFLGELSNTKLKYVGKVTVSKKLDIYNKILKMPINKNPFDEDITEEVKFIRPSIVTTIEFLEKTKSGHLRHAKFKGAK